MSEPSAPRPAPAGDDAGRWRRARSRFYFWLLVGMMVLVAVAGGVRLWTLPR